MEEYARRLIAQEERNKKILQQVSSAMNNPESEAIATEAMNAIDEGIYNERKGRNDDVQRASRERIIKIINQIPNNNSQLNEIIEIAGNLGLYDIKWVKEKLEEKLDVVKQNIETFSGTEYKEFVNNCTEAVKQIKSINKSLEEMTTNLEKNTKEFSDILEKHSSDVEFARDNSKEIVIERETNREVEPLEIGNFQEWLLHQSDLQVIISAKQILEKQILESANGNQNSAMINKTFEEMLKMLNIKESEMREANQAKNQQQNAEQGKTVKPNVRSNTSVSSKRNTTNARQSSISNISNDGLEGHSIDVETEGKRKRIEEIKKGISEYIVVYQSPTQNLLEEDQKTLQELEEQLKQLEQKREENQKVGFFKGLANSISGTNKKIEAECNEMKKNIDNCRRLGSRNAVTTKKQTLDNLITSMETLDMAAINEVLEYLDVMLDEISFYSSLVTLHRQLDDFKQTILTIKSNKREEIKMSEANQAKNQQQNAKQGRNITTEQVAPKDKKKTTTSAIDHNKSFGSNIGLGDFTYDNLQRGIDLEESQAAYNHETQLTHSKFNDKDLDDESFTNL